MTRAEQRRLVFLLAVQALALEMDQQTGRHVAHRVIGITDRIEDWRFDNGLAPEECAESYVFWQYGLSLQPAWLSGFGNSINPWPMV